jgi:hypothetical protein
MQEVKQKNKPKYYQTFQGKKANKAKWRNHKPTLGARAPWRAPIGALIDLSFDHTTMYMEKPFVHEHRAFQETENHHYHNLCFLGQIGPLSPRRRGGF